MSLHLLAHCISDTDSYGSLCQPVILHLYPLPDALCIHSRKGCLLCVCVFYEANNNCERDVNTGTPQTCCLVKLLLQHQSAHSLMIVRFCNWILLWRMIARTCHAKKMLTLHFDAEYLLFIWGAGFHRLLFLANETTIDDNEHHPLLCN